MRRGINWQIFFILLGLSIISIFAVFPYVVTLQKDVLEKVHQPLIIIFLAQCIQSSILFSIVIFLGMYLLKKIQFSLPLLNAITNRKVIKNIIKEIVPISIVSGIITAISIYTTDFIFTFLGASITTNYNPAPVWQRLLAAFYGGITEEILMRLFLMTVFIWFGMKIMKGKQPGQITIIVSIILASIIFGLGHLPVTASLTEITPLIILRAVVLNGIGGIIFGWLYWKKGLEAAMIAHFTADIFLLTILPTLFGK